MAAPPRAARLLAFVWLAVAFCWLAATTGCHGEPVPYGPSSGGGPLPQGYPSSHLPPPRESRRHASSIIASDKSTAKLYLWPLPAAPPAQPPSSSSGQ
ncbi:hypothetical protein EJB05_55399, partial [Eragrostis curvula]